MMHKKFSLLDEANRKKLANLPCFPEQRIPSDFLHEKSVDVVRA